MRKRVGLWLIGARGGVASCTIVGLAALRRKLMGNEGLVSALPAFQSLGLRDWEEIVVGGCEIRGVSLVDEVRRFAQTSRTMSPELLEAVTDELDAVDGNITWGSAYGAGAVIAEMADDAVPADTSPGEACRRIRTDLEEFARRHDLEHVVVINVASTEPGLETPLPNRWADWDPLLKSPGAAVPASTVYAIAALQAGCSYVNFTPSTGSAPPALDELAQELGSRHMGCDGKTGETLMKSVLAPMFQARNLRVMSWVGHNIFGNLDGKVLDHPENKRSKVVSKDHLLAEILGYAPQTHVSIEYIESMGDWKTAWDHIHFRGFLGTPMVLQFTWQGCDSILAAPLVLDLFRFVERAWRLGETGRLTFLAPFFKSPYGVAEQDFGRQTEMLLAWAKDVAARQP